MDEQDLIGQHGYYLSAYPRKYEEKYTKIKYNSQNIYSVTDMVMTNAHVDNPEKEPSYKRMKIGYKLDGSDHIWHSLQEVKDIIDRIYKEENK